MENNIQGLIDAALKNIKEMVNVNTIVGTPVETPDGTVIIPISKVAFGFGAGGSDYSPNKTCKNSKDKNVTADIDTMFGGGSGGGVSISPVAFMVVGNGQLRLMPINTERGIVDQIIDSVPVVVDKVNEVVTKVKDKKEAQKASADEC